MIIIEKSILNIFSTTMCSDINPEYPIKNPVYIFFYFYRLQNVTV